MIPLVMFLACVLAQAGCQCISGDRPMDPRQGVVVPAPEVETVAAGTIPGTFSIKRPCTAWIWPPRPRARAWVLGSIASTATA
ncbi:hypothetical protein BE20_06730 [Sorangium cellulosum]|nr:hypothetical protein BE20_06730 [Sorangium cellulosum]